MVGPVIMGYGSTPIPMTPGVEHDVFLGVQVFIGKMDSVFLDHSRS